ncbi:MAG: hypothetical protein ABSE71_04405 [Candidatus Micrarchaeaceae archaeon]|jgi:hypothetical protein|nr:hypothetical protein [Candidatus Micrarchaeota archaeon]HII09758.1 hypothetical protein [Candidatus Micrarchaeota archaeon]
MASKLIGQTNLPVRSDAGPTSLLREEKPATTRMCEGLTESELKTKENIRRFVSESWDECVFQQPATYLRMIWYDLFDPSSDKGVKAASYAASRQLFELFMYTHVTDLAKALSDNKDLNATSVPRNYEEHQNLVELVSLIPQGDHFVVPIMCSGVTTGAFINYYLKKSSRSLGFALSGYSNGTWTRVPNWYKDRVHIAEQDIELIRANRDRQFLLVDERTDTGTTISAITAELEHFGVKRINSLITPRTFKDWYGCTSDYTSYQ